MSKKKNSAVPKNENEGIPFVKNLLFLTVIGVFIAIVIRENEGYSWVWNSLINENLKFTNKSGHLSESQKMQSKFGIDAAVIDYIKQNTPENAVILFPPYSIMMADSASFQFKKDLGGIKSRNWTLDLLYPRKLVYSDEINKINFKNEVSHIVVMDGWGYDQLDYEIENKTNFDVLPLHKSNP